MRFQGVLRAVAVRPRSFILALALIIAAGAGAYLYGQGENASPQYLLARVERGPLAAFVSATGSLSAVTTVQVGSQVSGQLKTIHVDFNSRVTKGQLIAELEPDTFEAKVSQAKAQLDAAQATVLNQRALVERTRADLANARASLVGARAQVIRGQVALTDAKRDLTRRTTLHKQGLIAEGEKDAAQTAHDLAVAQLDTTAAQAQAQAEAARSAEAQLQVAEAQLQNAHAQVKDREAALRQAQVDLSRTKIRSPVDGVVVSRIVDAGQTLAASLQAPTLFTIAQDLTKMQVDTSVDEADIGSVQVGQKATFTVESFRSQSFTGTVIQIRKAPQVSQNVVTYNVVISAGNPDLKLLPGMTASVRILVDERRAALKVPNAALRFRPDGREATSVRGGGPAAGDGRVWGRVWVLGAGSRLEPVSLTLGVSDGSFTEVLDGGLREGHQVVIGSTEPPGKRRLRLRL
jgi:HlyD family secretion protein